MFFDENPIHYEIKNTSHGESDFREVVLAEWKSGKKFVIKLADNDFTFSQKIITWKRCIEEHRKLGYYCPNIISAKNDDYPTIYYNGHTCVVYAEEYSTYRSANSFGKDELNADARQAYMDDAIIMISKIASKKLGFTDYPSAYCLFDTFCPSDEVDEVMENALE